MFKQVQCLHRKKYILLIGHCTMLLKFLFFITISTSIINTNRCTYNIGRIYYILLKTCIISQLLTIIINIILCRMCFII